jgi:anti-anti-sigma factor
MSEIRFMVKHNKRGKTMKPPETHEITLARLGAVTLFDIKGEMTAFSEPMLDEVYQQAAGLKTRKILFNFNGCTYITSAGIGIFIQILAQAIKRNQLIGITGLTRHFVKIFNMLGITKFAKIHDSVQSAVLALNA